ncbi:tenectin [Haematobia irritans]|uniref:tenectin n=1 Tax=Haematobia irritans TaxID=7368 RepID=UPI003F503D6D
MTRKRSSPMGLDIYLSAMLAILMLPLLIQAAPLQDYTEIQQYTEGCYYNYNHYNEGDRIMTNEPCLNCTCHNKMLMCYLRVCPFTKPIGHDCIVEKREDQCCPIITCPEVPVGISHAAPEPGTELSIPEKFGCSIDGKFYLEGAQVPSNPSKPCELCYCIKNRTSCLMQECTLHIDGCTPIYNRGSCCPVRYNCDHENDVLGLEDHSTTTETTTTTTTTTTEKPTTGFILTSTMTPSISTDCIHNGEIYADGARIEGETPCENCYCMRGDIICAVQECKMPMLAGNGKQCHAMPPAEGECCPSNYVCEDDSATTQIYEATTLSYGGQEDEVKITTSSPIKDLHGAIPEEDMQLQTHIDEEEEGSTDSSLEDNKSTETTIEKEDEEEEDKSKEDESEEMTTKVTTEVESSSTSKPIEVGAEHATQIEEENKDTKPIVSDERVTDAEDDSESTTTSIIALDEQHIDEHTTKVPGSDIDESELVTKVPSSDGESTTSDEEISTKTPAGSEGQSSAAIDEHTTKASVEPEESTEIVQELATKAPADYERGEESTKIIDEYDTTVSGESIETIVEHSTKAPVGDETVKEDSTKASVTSSWLDEGQESNGSNDELSTKSPTASEEIEASTKVPLSSTHTEEDGSTANELTTALPPKESTEIFDKTVTVKSPTADADESISETSTKTTEDSQEESEESTEIHAEDITKAPIGEKETIGENVTKAPTDKDETSTTISATPTYVHEESSTTIPITSEDDGSSTDATDAHTTKAPGSVSDLSTDVHSTTDHIEESEEFTTTSPDDTKADIVTKPSAVEHTSVTAPESETHLATDADDDHTTKAPLAVERVEEITESSEEIKSEDEKDITKAPATSDVGNTTTTAAHEQRDNSTESSEEDKDSLPMSELSTTTPLAEGGTMETTDELSTSQESSTKSPIAHDETSDILGEGEQVTDMPSASHVDTDTESEEHLSTTPPKGLHAEEESIEASGDIESTDGFATKAPTAGIEESEKEQITTAKPTDSDDVQSATTTVTPIKSEDITTKAPAIKKDVTDKHETQKGEETASESAEVSDELSTTLSSTEEDQGLEYSTVLPATEISTKAPQHGKAPSTEGNDGEVEDPSGEEISTTSDELATLSPIDTEELGSGDSASIESVGEKETLKPVDVSVTEGAIYQDITTSKPETSEISDSSEEDVEHLESSTGKPSLVEATQSDEISSQEVEGERVSEFETSTTASKVETSTHENVDDKIEITVTPSEADNKIDHTTDDSNVSKGEEEDKQPSDESSTHAPSEMPTTAGIDRDSSEETDEDKPKPEGSDEEDDTHKVIDDKAISTPSPIMEDVTQSDEHKIEPTLEDVSKPTDSPMVIIGEFSSDNKTDDSTPGASTDKMPSINVKGDFNAEVATTTVMPSVEDMHDMQIPSFIPGEGDCLVGHKTYENNSVIPTSDECEISCKCVSSIVTCERVMCDVPHNVEKCVLDEASTNKCCPSYICGIDSLPPKEGESSESTEEDEDEEIEFTTVSTPHKIPEKVDSETGSPVVQEIEMPISSTEEPMSHIKDSDEEGLDQSTKIPGGVMSDDKADIDSADVSQTSPSTVEENDIKSDTMAPLGATDDKKPAVTEIDQKPEEPISHFDIDVIVPSSTVAPQTDEHGTVKPIGDDKSEKESSDESLGHTSKPIETPTTSTEEDKKPSQDISREPETQTYVPITSTEDHTETPIAEDHKDDEESSGELDHQTSEPVTDGEVSLIGGDIADTTQKPFDKDESVSKDSESSTETHTGLEETTTVPIEIHEGVSTSTSTPTTKDEEGDSSKETIDEDIKRTTSTPSSTESSEEYSTAPSVDKDESMDDAAHTVPTDTETDHKLKPLDHNLAPSIEESPSVSTIVSVTERHEMDDHTNAPPIESVTDQDADIHTDSPIATIHDKDAVKPTEETLESTIAPVVDDKLSEITHEIVSSTSSPVSVEEEKVETTTLHIIDSEMEPETQTSIPAIISENEHAVTTSSEEDGETQTSVKPTIPEHEEHITSTPVDTVGMEITRKPIDFDVKIDTNSEGDSVPSHDETSTTKDSNEQSEEDIDHSSTDKPLTEDNVTIEDESEEMSSTAVPATSASPEEHSTTIEDLSHKDTTLPSVQEGELASTTPASFEKDEDRNEDKEQEGHVATVPSIGEDKETIEPSMAHSVSSSTSEDDSVTPAPVSTAEKLDESTETVTTAATHHKEPSLDLSEEVSGESVESEEEEETKPVELQQVGAFVTERVDEITGKPTTAYPAPESDTSGEEDIESDIVTTKPDVPKVEHDESEVDVSMATTTKAPHTAGDDETSTLSEDMDISGVTTPTPVTGPQESTSEEDHAETDIGTDKPLDKEEVAHIPSEETYVSIDGDDSTSVIPADVSTPETIKDKDVSDITEAPIVHEESSEISSTATETPDILDREITTTTQKTEIDISGITIAPETVTSPSVEDEYDITTAPESNEEIDSVTSEEEDISSDATKSPISGHPDGITTSTKITVSPEATENSTTEVIEKESIATKAPVSLGEVEVSTSQESEEESDVTKAPILIEEGEIYISQQQEDKTTKSPQSSDIALSTSTEPSEEEISTGMKSPESTETEISDWDVHVTKSPINDDGIETGTSQKPEVVADVTQIPESTEDIETGSTHIPEEMSDVTKAPEIENDIVTKEPQSTEDEEHHEDVSSGSSSSDDIETSTIHYVEEAVTSTSAPDQSSHVESVTEQQHEKELSQVTKITESSESVESATSQPSETVPDVPKTPASAHEIETGTSQESEDVSADATTQQPEKVSKAPDAEEDDEGVEQVTILKPQEEDSTDTTIPEISDEVQHTDATKRPIWIDSFTSHGEDESSESATVFPGEDTTAQQADGDLYVNTKTPEMADSIHIAEDNVHVSHSTETPESDVEITSHLSQESVSAVTKAPEVEEDDTVFTKSPADVGPTDKPKDVVFITNAPEDVTVQQQGEQESAVTKAPESDEKPEDAKPTESDENTEDSLISSTNAPDSVDTITEEELKEDDSSTTKAPESTDTATDVVDAITKMPEGDIESSTSHEEDISGATKAPLYEESTHKTPTGEDSLEDHTKISEEPEVSTHRIPTKPQESDEDGVTESHMIDREHDKTEEPEASTHKIPVQQADELDEEGVTGSPVVGVELDKTDDTIPVEGTTGSSTIKFTEEHEQSVTELPAVSNDISTELPAVSYEMSTVKISEDHGVTELPAVPHDVSTVGHGAEQSPESVSHEEDSSEGSSTETEDSDKVKQQPHTTTVHPLFPHHGLSTSPSLIIDDRIGESNATDSYPTTTSSPIKFTEEAEDELYTTTASTTSSTALPITPPAPESHYQPQPPIYGQQPQYPPQYEDEYTDEDETEIFGPGTCRYGGKLYVSAQQIPRDDPCDFCFCFRSDIICLQQSCPPPIAGCHEEPISGFCCPRYECPVSMATVLNITTSTTTTSTTLPPHFLHHSYGGNVQRNGCLINGRSYSVGERIESTSGPCINCTCGGDGKMKCDPQACVPEPTMQQVMAVVAAGRKR